MDLRPQNNPRWWIIRENPRMNTAGFIATLTTTLASAAFAQALRGTPPKEGSTNIRVGSNRAKGN
jgi:hypothetical protein